MLWGHLGRIRCDGWESANQKIWRRGVVGQKRRGSAALHIDRARLAVEMNTRVPKWEGWGVPPCFFKECASGVESTRCKYSNFGSVEGVCFVRDGGRVSEGILAVCSNSWGDMEEYTMW